MLIIYLDLLGVCTKSFSWKVWAGHRGEHARTEAWVQVQLFCTQAGWQPLEPQLLVGVSLADGIMASTGRASLCEVPSKWQRGFCAAHKMTTRYLLGLTVEGYPAHAVKFYVSWKCRVIWRSGSDSPHYGMNLLYHTWTHGIYQWERDSPQNWADCAEPKAFMSRDSLKLRANSFWMHSECHSHCKG